MGGGGAAVGGGGGGGEIDPIFFKTARLASSRSSRTLFCVSNFKSQDSIMANSIQT